MTQVDALPTGGDTDDLAILGDCQTLYINTGDTYQPWLPVQDRDRLLVLDRQDRPTLHPGRARPDRTSPAPTARGCGSR